MRSVMEGGEIYGLSESKDDVKARVKEVCRAVVPEFNTSTADVAHRLGKINPKTSEYLKTNKLQLKEDLTPADRAARQRLWPEVERARKAGKSAYFVGVKAYVDGIQIRPKDGKMEI
ncbi:unnamed protein product [Leuciscus chuanchicus]